MSRNHRFVICRLQVRIDKSSVPAGTCVDGRNLEICPDFGTRGIEGWGRNLTTT